MGVAGTDEVLTSTLQWKHPISPKISIPGFVISSRKNILRIILGTYTLCKSILRTHEIFERNGGENANGHTLPSLFQQFPMYTV